MRLPLPPTHATLTQRSQAATHRCAQHEGEGWGGSKTHNCRHVAAAAATARGGAAGFKLCELASEADLVSELVRVEQTLTTAIKQERLAAAGEQSAAGAEGGADGEVGEQDPSATRVGWLEALRARVTVSRSGSSQQPTD